MYVEMHAGVVTVIHFLLRTGDFFFPTFSMLGLKPIVDAVL